MPGPAPKPASQRRRRNSPASYGAANPTTAGCAAPQPKSLGFKAHPLVADMWKALGESVESQFFSVADWQRARLELWHANSLLGLGRVQPTSWRALQDGLSELLVSPAAKRRAGIQLRTAADPDEADAEALVAELRRGLRSV